MKNVYLSILIALAFIPSQIQASELIYVCEASVTFDTDFWRSKPLLPNDITKYGSSRNNVKRAIKASFAKLDAFAASKCDIDNHINIDEMVSEPWHWEDFWGLKGTCSYSCEEAPL